MTDDIKDDSIQESIETEVKTEVNEEIVAEKAEPKKEVPQGYIDNEEEFRKKYPGKEFISAEEYKRNGALFKKIDRMSALLEQQERRNKEIEDKLRQKELEAHSQKLMNAFRGKNEAEFVRLHEEQKKLESPIENVTFNNEEIAQLNEFEAEHASDWCNKKTPENIDMINYATRMLRQSKALDPHLAMHDHIQIAEAAVKAKYKHRFVNANRRAAPSVVAGEATTSKIDKDVDVRSLPNEYRTAAKLYVKTGGTLTEYKKLMGLS